MEEGDLVLAPRGFVEDSGRKAKKECHFRSHDTTGPADHFALFLFSARRPDLSAPPSSPSPSFRLTRGVANRSREKQMDGCFLTFVNEFVSFRETLSIDNF